jgi:hypothetical protein
MGFRNPLTAADPTTVDTGDYDLLTPGVRLFQTEESNGDPGLGTRPVGILEMRDGIAGDLPAVRKLTAYTQTTPDPSDPTLSNTEVLGSNLSDFAGAVLMPSGLKYGPQTQALVEDDPANPGAAARSTYIVEADLIKLRGTLTGSGVAFLRTLAYLRSFHTANASDTFSAGAMTALIDRTWSNAPAGDYLCTVQLVVAASAAGTGNLRAGFWTPGGTFSNQTTDMRADRTTTPTPVTAAFTVDGWPGGNLRFQALFQSANTGTIFTNGSRMTVAYLGPRSSVL